MGTDKRDRQKANRASRVAAAEESARRARNRSRMITFGIVGIVIVGAIVGFAWLTSDDDGTETVETTDAVEPAAADTATETTSVPTIGVVDNGDTTEVDGFTYGTGECPAPDKSTGRAIDFTGPQPLCIDPAGDYVAVFDTSLGEVRVDLNAADVPGTVNNFVTLARWGYYDGTTVFRTDSTIDIVQGGAPHTEDNADPGPGYNIQDEPAFDVSADGRVENGPYRYVPGQLVMARTPLPDGASAQYFFNAGPQASKLDSQGVYVVFGQTDEAGIAVLEQMLALDAGGFPSETITVNSVTIEG